MNRQEAAFNALTELFSNPRIRSRSHFRYRIDGPTETEKAVEAILDEVLGSCWKQNHARWVSKLQRLGLIPDANDETGERPSLDWNLEAVARESCTTKQTDR